MAMELVMQLLEHASVMMDSSVLIVVIFKNVRRINFVLETEFATGTDVNVEMIGKVRIVPSRDNVRKIVLVKEFANLLEIPLPPTLAIATRRLEVLDANNFPLKLLRAPINVLETDVAITLLEDAPVFLDSLDLLVMLRGICVDGVEMEFVSRIEDSVLTVNVTPDILEFIVRSLVSNF